MLFATFSLEPDPLCFDGLVAIKTRQLTDASNTIVILGILLAIVSVIMLALVVLNSKQKRALAIVQDTLRSTCKERQELSDEAEKLRNENYLLRDTVQRIANSLSARSKGNSDIASPQDSDTTGDSAIAQMLTSLANGVGSAAGKEVVSLLVKGITGMVTG